MAHLRKLHECDSCLSSFYLTGIDSDSVATHCPYCGSDALQSDDDDVPQGLFKTNVDV